MTTIQLEVISRFPAQASPEPPLLFVHGAWHAAWCWDVHFLPFFAEQGYEAHALSLRGHGGSQGSYHGARIADFVSDVIAVSNQLRTTPILIGHSLGGMIVQKRLERHPAPAAVLLTSFPPSGAWSFLIKACLHQPVDAIRALIKHDLKPFVDTSAKASRLFFASDMPDSLVQEYTERLQGESIHVLLDILGLNLPQPKRVNAPLLVIGAEKDWGFSDDGCHATASAYRTQAHFIRNAAHDIMLGASWRAAAELILAWLRDRETRHSHPGANHLVDAQMHDPIETKTNNATTAIR